MIKKRYEVSCDLCGVGLNHYTRYKPTPKDLKTKGIKVKINNGKILTYCEKCYNEIKSKDISSSFKIIRKKIKRIIYVLISFVKILTGKYYLIPKNKIEREYQNFHNCLEGRTYNTEIIFMFEDLIPELNRE